jgi:hypothetical protein
MNGLRTPNVEHSTANMLNAAEVWPLTRRDVAIRGHFVPKRQFYEAQKPARCRFEPADG